MPESSSLDIRNIWQLTNSGFVLYSPVSILAYPVSILVVNPNSSALTLTFVGFLITLITFLPYLIFTKLVKKIKTSRATTKIAIFLLVISLSGALRGLVFYSADDYLGLIQPSSLFDRILASMFTTLFWLSASNMIVNISRNFKLTYQSALNQFLQTHVRDLNQSNKLNTKDSEILLFENDLSKSLSQLLGNSDSEMFRKVSQDLTSLINEQLRPLSRRIWLRSLSEYPVINYKGLLRDSVRLLDFSKVGFLIIMSVLALLNNLFLRDIGESLDRSLSYLFITFLLMFGFNILRKRKNRNWLNYLFLVVIAFIPIFASELFVDVLGYQSNYLAALLITPVPTAVVIVLSLFNLTQKDRFFLLSLLETNSEVLYDQMAAGVDLDQRQIASYLHNSFQSELLALSAQLASAAISGDKEITSSALQRASAVATRSLSEDLARLKEQPLDRLASVISSWKNILDIKIDIDEELLHKKCNNTIFTQTVEEIASNAFRHDKATSLLITACPGDLGTRVFFQSNGSQPISKSEGMGHSWLNQVSLMPYSIEKNEIGTLVVVEI